MNKIYYWADLHIGHAKAYTFGSKDGDRKMRPFKDMYEGEKMMVDNYNSIVTDNDIVYFLGDVLLDKDRTDVLSFMKKGAKHLVLGNHDNKGDVAFYRQFFDKIYGVLYRPKIKSILSHMPVHPSFLGPQTYLSGDTRFDTCIHGHTHDNHVLLSDRSKDYRYLNCCVEVTNYKPVTFEQLTEINLNIEC
jgi:calcineurin-like phosphoesterase family protein